jgi:hypothetical protein
VHLSGELTGLMREGERPRPSLQCGSRLRLKASLDGYEYFMRLGYNACTSLSVC